MKSFTGAVLFIRVAFSTNVQPSREVSGNGSNRPSCIIGTHHLVPFSIMDSITGLKKAMNEAQQVYEEMRMSEVQSPATMEKMQKVMMIESDTTLNSLLSPKDFETANKFCKESLMVDLDMAPKLKPAFLLNNVAVVAYVKHIRKFDSQEQLDTFFQNQAVQNREKVDGLETAEFQFNLLFNGSSLRRRAQLLMCTLNHTETEVENLKRLTNAYMNQNLNTVLKISEECKGDQCDALLGEEDVLIYNRNRARTEKPPAIMKATLTSVAVGALHLLGEKGLLNLLKRQRYTVEAVKQGKYLVLLWRNFPQ